MKPFGPIRLASPVSILMPVCNEAGIIEAVIEEWVEDVIQHLPACSELLIEEAASTDGTREVLTRLSEKYPFMRVNYRDRKDGFANAARRLYREARCPWLFFTDSDGQYVAKNFWILAQFMDAYDYIRGAKAGRKDPLGRRFASMIFNKIVHFLFVNEFADLNSAFHLIRKEVIDDLLPELKSMPTLINTELLLRAKLSNYLIKECYVMHRIRRFGTSKGLPPYRFFFDSIGAIRGLYDIKASYRRE